MNDVADALEILAPELLPKAGTCPRMSHASPNRSPGSIFKCRKAQLMSTLYMWAPCPKCVSSDVIVSTVGKVN